MYKIVMSLMLLFFLTACCPCGRPVNKPDECLPCFNKINKAKQEELYKE
jgi:hypothetical protein